jgi:Dolichyl-phosphate-mannose-protein mannosyltransferase
VAVSAVVSLRRPSVPLPAAGAAAGARARLRGERLWVAGLLLLALAARLFASVGVSEGGALVVGECDEPFVQEIAPIVASGNPLYFGVFFYPPVAPVINAGLARLWAILGGGGGLGVQCRAVTLIVSVATVAAVYLLGRLWGPVHGLIAMTLYAVTMIAVVVQGNVQVYSTFFLVLALYCVFRADAEGTTGWLARAGLCLGLGAGSKYSPLFFAGMLGAPFLLSRWGAPRAPEASRGAGPTGETGRADRLWQAALAALMAAALVTLWIGVVDRDGVYDHLRQLYARQAHDNPFEYHLPWIDRLYRLVLGGVGLVGGVAAVALLIPRVRGVPAWEWAKGFYGRNRLWIVPAAVLAATFAITVGLPALLNLNDFARHSVFLAKAMASGDNGMFPANRPAVSYIGGYFPESTGVPLFVAGLVGIGYAVLRRDRRALIALLGAVPAYAVLELAHVKVNRYALEMFPLWCVFASIWLGDLWQRADGRRRWLARALPVAVAAYSLVYALAWAEFFSPRGNVQHEAGEWLRRAVPMGTTLGVRSSVLVSSSPELLPDERALAGYRLVDYADAPAYVLVPNGARAVVAQYLDELRHGYAYTANDWFPSEPSAPDLEVLSRIVREDGWVLTREFGKRPEFLGLRVGSGSLTGRTWLVEHSPPGGLSVYRRVGRTG